MFDRVFRALVNLFVYMHRMRFKNVFRTLNHEFPVLLPMARVGVYLVGVAGLLKLGMVTGDWLFPSSNRR